MVRVSVDAKEKSVLFSPEITKDNDLGYCENISSVKRGSTQHVHVNVINSTKRDICLKKGYLLGTLSSVSAVMPIDLEKALPKEENLIGDQSVFNLTPSN